MQRRLTAIVAADVVGYSRLMGADEEGTLARLKAFRSELVEPGVARSGGRIVKTTGDGMLLEFASPVEAVRWAVELNEALAAKEAHLSERTRIVLRIGIHLGDVIAEDDGDLYGDGINVAARLEQLAPSGAIIVSGPVHEQVRDRLPYRFLDLGEQQVKNIARPVRMFQIHSAAGAISAGVPISKWWFPGRIKRRQWRLALAFTGAAILLAGAIVLWQPWTQHSAPDSTPPLAHALPDKPSIAVLPFTNISGDPQQEYFADGMTDDVITDLSKISDLFVVARNSTFTYKGKPVKVRQVAQDLGVRYVLEGSVQRAGERIRINAQLIDGTTGGHLWAERYDGSMADVFGLQDQVTRKIVAALALSLDAANSGHHNTTADPQAYDAFLHGWNFYRRFSADDFAKAVPYFERAIRLDPNYGRPYAALASIYWESWRQGESWTSKVNPDKNHATSFFGARSKAEKYAELAMRNPSPLAHRVTSAIYWDYRQFDEAIAEAERAVTQDPNDPDGYIALAWALIFSGRHEAALSAVERAMRLDPLHPEAYMYVLGMIRLGLAQFDDAVTALESVRHRSPQTREVEVPLAVAYQQLGRHEQAQAALQRYMEAWSMHSTSLRNLLSWWPYQRESDIRRFGGALVAAGLCCKESLAEYIEHLSQGGTLQ